eukprot:m.234058 g.234058  ORF g.234058 m.234058 type:complete len:155 (+) comp13912_c0_seq5:1477-1941(+)
MGDDVKYKSIMPAFSRDLISRLAMAACAKIQSDGLFVQLRTDRETNQPKINVSHSIEPPTSYNTQIKPKQSNNKATPSSISTSTQEQKQEQEVKILKASLQESTEEKDQLLRALHDLVCRCFAVVVAITQPIINLFVPFLSVFLSVQFDRVRSW